MKRLTVFVLILVVLNTIAVFAETTIQEEVVIQGDSLLVHETTTALTKIEKESYVEMPQIILINPALRDSALSIIRRGGGEITIKGKEKRTHLFSSFPIKIKISREDTIFYYSSSAWTRETKPPKVDIYNAWRDTMFICILLFTAIFIGVGIHNIFELLEEVERMEKKATNEWEKYFNTHSYDDLTRANFWFYDDL